MGNFVQILTSMSEESQIFFTSFKHETLRLPNMKIFQAEFDKSSHFTGITPEQAEEILFQMK